MIDKISDSQMQACKMFDEGRTYSDIAVTVGYKSPQAARRDVLKCCRLLKVIKISESNPKSIWHLDLTYYEILHLLRATHFSDTCEIENMKNCLVTYKNDILKYSNGVGQKLYDKAIAAISKYEASK